MTAPQWTGIAMVTFALGFVSGAWWHSHRGPTVEAHATTATAARSSARSAEAARSATSGSATADRASAADRSERSATPRPRRFVANLQPLGSSQMAGVINFLMPGDDSDELRVDYRLARARPGNLRFEIRAHGDCTSPAAVASSEVVAEIGKPGQVIASMVGRARGSLTMQRLSEDQLAGNLVMVSGSEDAPSACGVIK